MIRKLTIMVVVSNFVAYFLIAAGAPAVFGLTPQPGVDSEIERANQSATEIRDEQLGAAESVVGTTITGVDVIDSLLSAMFAAPTVLLNFGVPGFIVALVFAPQYIAASIELAEFIRGVELQ